jgi:pimeloyl-ACP methyl ester carboxylesterase
MSAVGAEHEVRTPGGRVLHVREAGDPGGAPVLVHHGTPGSGLLAGAWAEDARAHGIRLVGFDRPGYGGSDRHPGRSVADVAADAAAVMDALGTGPFRTWGVSGGGPHALACAALLPERVTSAAVIGSVAPFGADGLDWMAGMGRANIEEFSAALEGPDALRPFLARESAELVAGGPAGLTAGLASILPPVDAAALTGEFGDFVYAWMATGLRAGDGGWLDDDLAFVRSWGFDPADITVPVLLLQGRQDLMVPFAHGQWLAARIPAVTGWLTDGDGHLNLLAQVGRVHEWLLQH